MIEFFTENVASSQTLIFGVVVTGLWVVEQLVLHPPLRGRFRHTAVNSLFILSAMPIELVCGVFCLTVADWVTKHHFGLLFYLPYSDSPWVKYGVMFFVLDLLDYVYHQLMHQIPAFWRFHLVHHTDPVVDTSTTVREHPGETTLRNGFLMLWVLLTGASFELLILRQAAQTIATIFAHSAVRLPPRLARVLGWFFITPNLHHVHHHFELPYTNRNYGDVFSIWDRLFGTFANLSAEETLFGLDTHQRDAERGSFVGMLSMPFGKKGEKAVVPVMATSPLAAATTGSNPHYPRS